MNFNRLHEAELAQLTGCRYPVIVLLESLLNKALRREGAGRPFKYSVRTMLMVTLIKLRGELAYRTLAVFLKISYTTLQRYTHRVCEVLASLSLSQYIKSQACQYLIVDGTCSRVRSTDIKNYSGHKHHKNCKVQMIINDQRQIIAVSKSYEGGVHDKTIWNKEYDSLKDLFTQIILADKGYAGTKGEYEKLFRPIKRNEIEYKANKEATKSYNRELSKKRVLVENCFAHVKDFKILRNLFPLQAKRYGTVFKAVALIYNLNLDEKLRQQQKVKATPMTA